MEQSNQRICATSNPLQISFILEILQQLQPRSLLDIGSGSGKYGVLAREYLRTARIDGIEGFAEYITGVHKVVYDQLYQGDALKIIPTLGNSYDLAMLIDVFEHFTLVDGAGLLRDLAQRSQSILISVPVGHAEHGALHGNQYEIHRAVYDVQTLRSLGFQQIWRIGGSYIALRGPKKVNLRLTVLKCAATCLLPSWVSRAIAPVARKLFPTRWPK